jgi:serine/threonine-protein kinase
MAPEQGEVTRKRGTNECHRCLWVGAVLYHLLTDQPLFAEEQLTKPSGCSWTEPRPPRQLNPKIDRDLSTICLKCLEKDPAPLPPPSVGRRLGTLPKHEPIRAKPSGFFKHSRKWVAQSKHDCASHVTVALAVGLSVTIWNREPQS